MILTPTVSWAQNTNVSIQESSNSTIVVGGGTVNQRNSQSNFQNYFGSHNTPSRQESIQRSRNNAAAMGNNNFIEQNSQQQNFQNRFNQNSYYNSYFNRSR